MKPIPRNILAFIAGVVVGCIVNISLVSIGPSIITLPEGADVSTPEGLAASMSLLSPRHFLVPFLGHALGTLAGAFVVVRLAASAQQKLALGIGALFFIGGAMMVKMVGGPIWFSICDLVLAYWPMGFLGWQFAGGSAKPTVPSSASAE